MCCKHTCMSKASYIIVHGKLRLNMLDFFFISLLSCFQKGSIKTVVAPGTLICSMVQMVELCVFQAEYATSNLDSVCAFLGS